MKLKIIAGGASALLAAGVLAFGAAAPASAHTPTASATCEALTVDALYYDGVKPAQGEPTITVDNPDYKPATEGTPSVWAVFSPNDSQGPFEGTPTYPTDDRGTWQIKGQLPGGHEGPDGVYQKGNGNGSWFYRHAAVDGSPAVGEPTVTKDNPEYVAEDTTPNSVVVTIDGQQVAAEEFGSSFHAVYPFTDKYTAHQWSVAIKAWNDADGSKGWTKTITGTSTPCEQPVVSIPCTASGDWYTEGDDVAPSLSPEGYVFQSTDTKVAGLRASAGGNLQGWAPVTYSATGDTGSFWYRIVLDTSADGGWSYMSATVTSGQPVTSSSTAYVSKLGQSFTLAELAEKYPHNVITSVGFHLDRGHGPVTLSSVGGACGTADFTTTQPEDEVVTTNGKPIVTCDNKVGDVVDVVNTITTTPYVWDGGKFVLGEPVETKIAGTYVVTQADIDALDCAVVVPPTEEPKPQPKPVVKTVTATSTDTLAQTGSALEVGGWIGAALILLIGGAGTIWIARLRRQSVAE